VVSDKTGGTFEQWVHPKALDYFETQLGFKRCVYVSYHARLFIATFAIFLCGIACVVPLRGPMTDLRNERELYCACSGLTLDLQ